MEAIELLIILAAIFLNGLFFYIVIRIGTRTKRQIWTQRQQLNLLIEIVKKIDATGKLDIDYIKEKNNTNSDEYLV